MLVLTRRIGEGVLIGDDIRVRVVRMGGCRVRLAITAPTGVRVMREEAMKADEAESQDGKDGE